MPDGERFESHFDVETWAKGHEKLDDLRFKALFSALGVGVGILIAVCGWSLKVNYDNADRTVRAIESVRPTIQAGVNPWQK